MDSTNVYVSDKTTDDTDTQLMSIGLRKVRDLPLLEKKEFIKKMTYFWLLQAKIEIIAYEIVKAIGPARDFMAFDIRAFYFWFAPIITVILLIAVYFEQWRYKPYSYYILIIYPISYAITLMQLHGIILYYDEDKHFDYKVADIFSAILTSCFPALLSIVITLRRSEGFKLKLKTLIPITCLLFILFRLIAFILQRPGKNTQYYLSIFFGFIFTIAYLCIYLRGVRRVIKGQIRMNEEQDVASPMILFIHLVK